MTELTGGLFKFPEKLWAKCMSWNEFIMLFVILARRSLTLLPNVLCGDRLLRELNAC